MRRIVTLACIAWLAPEVRAQNAPQSYAEYRTDAIVATRTSVQAGAGAVVPLGVYVRLGLDGALGGTFGGEDGAKLSGRVDAIGRFLLDPLREVPVAVSLGGGVSVPYAAGDAHVRPLLVAVVDVEGRKRGSITPTLEVGLGGGARIGIVLRRSPPRWR